MPPRSDRTAREQEPLAYPARRRAIEATSKRLQTTRKNHRMEHLHGAAVGGDDGLAVVPLLAQHVVQQVSIRARGLPEWRVVCTHAATSKRQAGGHTWHTQSKTALDSQLHIAPVAPPSKAILY